MRLVWDYVRALYNLARMKFIINVLLMAGLGTMEGIGVLMIIPLLYVTGVVPGMQAGSELTSQLARWLRNIGIELNLPVVLALYILLNCGQSWLQRRQKLLSFDIQQAFNIYISARLYRAVVFAEWQLLMSKTKAGIANTIFSEIFRVYSGISNILQVMATTLVTAVQIILALLIAPGLTFCVLGGAAVLFLLLQTFLKESRRIGEEASAIGDRLFFDLTEHLNGIKEVKSCGIESAQVAEFIGIRTKLTDNLRRYIVLQTGTDVLYQAGAAVFISLFLFSAVEIFALRPVDFIVIAVIAARLWPKISSIQQGIQNAVNLTAAFQVVSELESECLAARENLPEAPAADRIELKQGIAFRDVAFFYDSSRDVYAVQDVDLFLRAGTTTAFVGVSGSGKSTLVDLLLGLLLPKRGEILIDGAALTDNLRPWRNSIGYVSQDAFLSNVSIRENLLWVCPNASEEDIWAALKAAAIDSLVGRLPNGLDTLLGDRGVRLSGGERQRIVLARALLRKPSILILDEATSSLDAENERRIQQAIENLQGKMTIMVVAHRLSTIHSADLIVVLEQGRIVEQGNYRSLMAIDDGRFRALACLYAD